MSTDFIRTKWSCSCESFGLKIFLVFRQTFTNYEGRNPWIKNCSICLKPILAKVLSSYYDQSSSFLSCNDLCISQILAIAFKNNISFSSKQKPKLSTSYSIWHADSLLLLEKLSYIVRFWTPNKTIRSKKTDFIQLSKAWAMKSILMSPLGKLKDSRISNYSAKKKDRESVTNSFMTLRRTIKNLLFNWKTMIKSISHRRI